ncbi:Protein VAC14-like protein [Zea mays]|nr:Protein VAC14-like protein [Zea mays]
MAEILVRRAGSTDEFTRLTSITWINEFVKLGGEQLVPYYADILGAVLPCISDEEEKIRVVARETNEELRAIKADPAEGFDIGAILSIAKRELNSEHEATRIEALHWFFTLLDRYCAEFLAYLNDIFDPLLNALSDPSDAPAHEKIGVVDSQWIVHQVIPSLGNQGQSENGRAPWEGLRERCRKEWGLFQTRMAEAEKAYYEMMGITPPNVIFVS